MFKNFFNTTGIKDTSKKEKKAATQNQVVLQLFIKHKALGPSQVFGKLNERMPITSVRRAINTLTRDGHLKKTNVKQRGLYGDSEHVWRLAD